MANKSQQAPKNEAPVSTPTQSETTVETPVAPVAAIVTVKPTIDDLRKAANEAAQRSASFAMDESKSDDEKLKAALDFYKATKAVTDAINAEKQAKAAAELEAKKRERAKIFDEAINAYDAYLTAKAVYDASAKTAEDIAAMNEVYHAYTDAADLVRNALMNGTPKTTVHIPMGTTGKQLAAASTGGRKSDEIIAKLDAGFAAGKNVGELKQELLAEGYMDGTIRTAIWLRNRREKGVA